MEQQIIEKLMEIKKLYEAGILTKEEMEAEKAKILHSSEVITEKEDEPNVEEPVSEEIGSDAIPVMTDSEGRFVFDAPKTEQIQTNSSSTQQTIKSNSKLYWICGIGILVFIILFLALSNKTNNEPVYYSEEATASSIAYDEPANINDEDDTEIETTETGAWAGRTIIEGGMYRNCLTCAYIDLVSDGNNNYHGTIKIHASDGLNGCLEGNVTANGSARELTIQIIEPYVTPGDNGNVFDEPEFYKPIQKNSDIFRITKQGVCYSAHPLGNMSDYFDGIADEIIVNKQ